MADFDYGAAAELYPARGWSRARDLGYYRFDTAAEALRFAIEEMPADLLRGAILEIDEARFDGEEIRALYDGTDYPLERKTA